MWKKHATRSWWVCETNWDFLNEKNEEDRQIIEKNKATFGEDRSKWPRPGCGANFIPWKYGPAMVLQFPIDAANLTKNEEDIVCIRAEVPTDAVNKAMNMAREKMHTEMGWMENAQLTARELFNMIPNVSPVTIESQTVYDDRTFGSKIDRKPVAGIGRLDIPKWEADNGPTLDEVGWLALCEKVKDLSLQGTNTPDLTELENPGTIFHTENVMDMMKPIEAWDFKPDWS